MKIRYLLFLPFLNLYLAAHEVNAQQNKYTRLMRGKWLTEEDTNSVLIFDKQYVYQSYVGTDYNDTCRYYFTDSCRFSSSRNDFMFWVTSNSIEDTTWLEIMGISAQTLSFFVFNTSKPMWILTKAPKQK